MEALKLPASVSLHWDVSFFNEIIPQDLGICRQKHSGNELLLKLEVDFHVGKKQLKQILEKVINTHGATRQLKFWTDSKQWVTNILQEQP